ncbi:DNA repair protein RecO [Corynebacterium heidelbergense]|uniref:DNA repair protein RecO n=1 Tax=Corynebacterium heidelbergense TaxID=2055947 RepID=A0A364VDJ5_9CORY|nr:DNA repair protein RecO [Corynebacterium heidelbergense]RAV33113.1 DNA repair protein RecO [Corynebacterium heidelbergense]RAV34688.1 DNA repair protein RecO [Corynebacterium heidelbergense]WCZ36265.1 DNA repair protein RecO [Corynebacterium heidelbergense]
MSAAPARRSWRPTRPNYRDQAFVVRSHKLGEADLILVLLTREHGVVRGVAKGIRKTKSRFGSRLDRFSRVDVQLYPGRNLANITDAATVATYAAAIVADPDRYFAGVAMLEMSQYFGAAEGAGQAVFTYLDAALARLAGPEGDLPPVCVADGFVLRCLEETGWMPSLVDCSQCGKPGPHRAFHPAAGGAVCVTCRPPGSATPPPQAVRLLWLLWQGRLGTAETVAREPGIAAAAHQLLVSHVRHQVDVPATAYGSL